MANICHRPILKFFNPQEAIPSYNLCWSSTLDDFLSSFNYTIWFKKSANHANADGLYRHPIEKPYSIDAQVCKSQHDYLESLPVDCKQIRERNRVNPIISQSFSIYSMRLVGNMLIGGSASILAETTRTYNSKRLFNLWNSGCHSSAIPQRSPLFSLRRPSRFCANEGSSLSTFLVAKIGQQNRINCLKLWLMLERRA